MIYRQSASMSLHKILSILDFQSCPRTFPQCLCRLGNFNLNTTEKTKYWRKFDKAQKIIQIAVFWRHEFSYFFRNKCFTKRSVLHPFELLIHLDESGAALLFPGFICPDFLQIFCSREPKNLKEFACTSLSFWSCPLEGASQMQIRVCISSNKTIEALPKCFNFHKIYRFKRFPA